MMLYILHRHPFVQCRFDNQLFCLSEICMINITQEHQNVTD